MIDLFNFAYYSIHLQPGIPCAVLPWYGHIDLINELMELSLSVYLDRDFLTTLFALCK